MKRSVFCTADTIFSAKRMFDVAGWEIADSIQACDVVYFMTGPDPDPSFYHQTRGSKTYFNPQRDLQDFAFWIVADLFKKPCVGTGRGAIFLNAMCNGNTWQHVDRHCMNHAILDLDTGGEFVSQASSHHQMMEPAPDAEVIWIASESTKKEKHCKTGPFTLLKKAIDLPTYRIPEDQLTLYDPEAIMYRHSKVLCVQPVPEFGTNSKIQSRFFQLIEEIL